MEEIEFSLYYLQSRYYDPELGRFINADTFASTGQGILGNNMFAYCLNNPANHADVTGCYAISANEAQALWLGMMSWLPFVDGILPFGEGLYALGFLLLGADIIFNGQDCIPEVSIDSDADVFGSPSPNNGDDDEEDDDYDDRHFGGRIKIGKSKGKTPGNNQAQNKQFNDATKGLTPAQKRIVHEKISKKNYGYHEIKALVDELFVFIIGLFATKE